MKDGRSGEIGPNGVTDNTIVGFYVDSTGYANGFIAVVPEPSCLFLFAVAGLTWGGSQVFKRRHGPN